MWIRKNLSFNDADRLIRIVSGKVRIDRLTLFSTMRNEMAFLPGWLEYHRGIGFDQFLIWDDASDDGTYEYLCDQSDCVVLRSDMDFGHPVIYHDPRGVSRKDRFGIYVKAAAPQHYLNGHFVGYLDADEFLILPPGVLSVATVIARLRVESARSCLASVIEFFPASSGGLDGAMPKNFQDLLGAYPYFQAEKLIELLPGKKRWRFCGLSKTARLYARYSIKPPLFRRGFDRIWMPSRTKRAQLGQTSPRHKTPVILRQGDSFQVGSHNASVSQSGTVLLSIAHFVFTARLKEKTQVAIERGAHALGGRKYRGYAALLDAMDDCADGFLDFDSVCYEGPEQLMKLGLMQWA